MALHLILILGLFLLAVAVTMVLRALTSPRGPSTETIEQIGHYGFAAPSRPAAAKATTSMYASASTTSSRRPAGGSAPGSAV
jgi:hypothetical protein